MRGNVEGHGAVELDSLRQVVGKTDCCRAGKVARVAGACEGTGSLIDAASIGGTAMGGVGTVVDGVTGETVAAIASCT